VIKILRRRGAQAAGSTGFKGEEVVVRSFGNPAGQGARAAIGVEDAQGGPLVPSWRAFGEYHPTVGTDIPRLEDGVIGRLGFIAAARARGGNRKQPG